MIKVHLGDRTAARDYRRHWTPVHLDFIVDDLDAVVARLLERGGRLDRRVKPRDYGRIANMADPFGNGFDLIEFSGGGYDNLPQWVSFFVILGLAPRIHFPFSPVMTKPDRQMDPRDKPEGDGLWRGLFNSSSPLSRE